MGNQIRTFDDLAAIVALKEEHLTSTALEAKEELGQRLAKEKEISAEKIFRDMPRLEKLILELDSVFKLLRHSEMQTILAMLADPNKMRIFSTNFAIGFFRGMGWMLGAVVIIALTFIIIVQTPYANDLYQMFYGVLH